MSGEGGTVRAYAESFDGLAASLPGAGTPWLAALRKDAIGRFADAGFPTRKNEAYKYTNLSALSKTLFEPARGGESVLEAGVLEDLRLDNGAHHLLVFVDGRLRPECSGVGDLPAGVTITNLARALEDDPALLEAHLGQERALDAEPVRALNTAFMSDGAVVRLAAGVTLEAPVHLVYLTSVREAPTACPTRNLIVAEAGSSATVIETYAGPDGAPYWTNAVTQVSLREGATVRHYRLQREGNQAIHLATTIAQLAAGSAYESFVLSLGAGLARNEIAAVLDGEGADCRLNGVYLGRGTQHIDNSTWIDHASPGSASREVYKGVLDGEARGVFQGKITVRPRAQKTDAHQLSKTLLLSERAEINAKPELEIHADDVKCSHGATSGELDGDAIFYLRSRGLDEASARRFLVEAFVAEIVESIEVEAVRSHFARFVSAWLHDGDDRGGS